MEISQMLLQLSAGDSNAQRKIFEIYAPLVRNLAERYLMPDRQRMFDADDVVGEAFQSFFRQVKAPDGNVEPKKQNEQSLLRLLYAIARHKALNLNRLIRTQKRGGGSVREVGESALLRNRNGHKLLTLEAYASSSSPSAEEVLVLEEQTCRLLDALNETQRKVLLLRLDGYTNPEIAKRMGCCVSNVERKFMCIREKWEYVQNR